MHEFFSENEVPRPSPYSVGGIKPGCFKIGNTGGMIDNIISCKLYRPGSVGYVSKSGGMSNELNNLLARFAGRLEVVCKCHLCNVDDAFCYFTIRRCL